MLLYGLTERAEDDPLLGELLLVGGADRDGVEDRGYRHSGEQLLLLEWNAELLIGLDQLGIHLVQTSERRLAFGCGVVADRLVVDRIVLDVRPVRLGHLEPPAVRPEPPLKQPL